MAGVRGTSFTVEAGEVDRFVLLEGSLWLESLEEAGGQFLGTLDQPGAFFGWLDDGAPVQGQIAPEALVDLLRDIGGISSTLVEEMLEIIDAGDGEEDGDDQGQGEDRDDTRKDMVGPDGLVDSPIEQNNSNDLPPMMPPPQDSNVRVQIEVQ